MIGGHNVVVPTSHPEHDTEGEDRGERREDGHVRAPQVQHRRQEEVEDPRLDVAAQIQFGSKV